ncbi:MAG: DNA repair protein RecN [Oscillospiraceae bacterium]|nr:DNA repair protein RecN [Oscillospiraceae bacterium]
MLKLLHIENIAVIQQCDIEFGEGFNVLTGETGAGKSIIIDAIGAVLGYRTSREVIRNGAQKASVSAVFCDCNDEVYAWLSENGFEAENNEIIVSREISLDGKSSARINGRPVTASLLKNFGVLLINILGQHDSQQLLDAESHAIFIDRFASDSSYLETEAKYTSAYERLQEINRELARLDMDEAGKARQVEMLKFQINELESADLREGEDTELFERQKIIRDGAKVTGKLNEANSAFSGTDEFIGVCSALLEASKALSSISEISEKFADVLNKVTELYYVADDVSEQIRDMLYEFDFSEDDANEVESRLDVIHKLKRKYGNDVSEMLVFLENAKKELSEIEFSEERIQDLQNEQKRVEGEACALAGKLLEYRISAARKFEESITSELSQLDMKNAKFIAQITKNETLSQRGIDTIEFLLAANLGEAPKPLEKIASGGELSRIMLAMKNALDENDYVSTLIFDEIDTGVSGRAAQRIAEKLYKLSVKKQVLCVTHLAQLSAMADIHFKIEKTERDGRTFTNVNILDRAGRESELARITGGSQISDTTLKNSAEMLDLAESSKKLIRK